MGGPRALAGMDGLLCGAVLEFPLSSASITAQSCAPCSVLLFSVEISTCLLITRPFKKASLQRPGEIASFRLITAVLQWMNWRCERGEDAGLALCPLWYLQKTTPKVLCVLELPWGETELSLLPWMEVPCLGGD